MRSGKGLSGALREDQSENYSKCESFTDRFSHLLSWSFRLGSLIGLGYLSLVHSGKELLSASREDPK